MAWKIYFVSYECKSPLHIGYREIGNMVKTRYYIPGRALWGALTANLTRTLYPNGASPLQYKNVGEYIENHLRFGYLFPASKPENQQDCVFRPVFKKEGEHYGTLTRDEFERRYLNSWASTAIGTSTFAQEDGSLHETEILTPRENNFSIASKLYCNGFTYFDQNRLSIAENTQTQNDDFILTLAEELMLGGERRYGFGRVKLIEHRFLKEDNGTDPQPEDYSNEYLASHLCYKSSVESKIRGPIEPFLGRAWQSHTNVNKPAGAGQKFSPAQICWIPGSHVLDKNMLFVVKPFGLWEAA